MGLRQRAAEDGEILAVDEDLASADEPAARDHAVARHAVLSHAELGRAVLDEHVELLEAAFVEQQFEPFACGELAAGVLRLDALLAAAEPRLGAFFLELLQNLFHGPRPRPRPPRVESDITESV